MHPCSRNPRIIASSQSHNSPNPSCHNCIVQRSERCPPSPALHILYVFMGKTCYYRKFFGNVASLRLSIGKILNSSLHYLSCYFFCPVLIKRNMRCPGHSYLLRGCYNFCMELFGNLRKGRHNALYIHNHCLYKSCHDSKLLIGKASCSGDSVTHHYFIGCAAHSPEIDSFSSF